MATVLQGLVLGAVRCQQCGIWCCYICTYKW